MFNTGWKRIRQYVVAGDKDNIFWLLTQGARIDRGIWYLIITPEIEAECKTLGIKLSPKHPKTYVKPEQTWQNTGHFDY